MNEQHLTKEELDFLLPDWKFDGQFDTRIHYNRVTEESEYRLTINIETDACNIHRVIPSEDMFLLTVKEFRGYVSTPDELYMAFKLGRVK